MTHNRSLDDVWPLQRIFERNEKFFQEVETSYRQFANWSEPTRAKRIGFPEPVKQLGRYNFYSEEAVIEWVTLWTRVNRYGNPTLND